MYVDTPGYIQYDMKLKVFDKWPFRAGKVIFLTKVQSFLAISRKFSIQELINFGRTAVIYFRIRNGRSSG